MKFSSVNQSSDVKEADPLIPFQLSEIITANEKREFDHLVRLACLLTGSPVASLTFVDGELNLNTYPCVFRQAVVFSDGLLVGHLIVAFTNPVVLTPDQREGLSLLAIQIAALLQIHLSEDRDLQLREQLAIQHRQSIDFCNVVSHNLRGPLINLGMLAEFIKEAEDPEEQLMLVSKMEPVIEELKGTFNDLIASIQIREETNLEVDELDFNIILKESVTRLSLELGKVGGRIDGDFSDAPVVHFPNKYLLSVFYNLLSNAIRYHSPDRPLCIHLSSQMQDNKVVLMVEDNGLGIDLSKHQHNLFKMGRVFHRRPDAKGLGLFMTKTQVEAMGGRIWVDSKPDQWTKFFIEFANQPVNRVYSSN